nr:MAG TPA: hypothetical protein [Caudoviricetes sp.]
MFSLLCFLFLLFFQLSLTDELIIIYAFIDCNIHNY